MTRREGAHETIGNKTVGWYVEVPRELYDEFCRLYPHKGSKNALTVAAIEHAIRCAPSVLARLYEDSASSNEGHVRTG